MKYDDCMSYLTVISLALDGTQAVVHEHDECPLMEEEAECVLLVS